MLSNTLSYSAYGKFFFSFRSTHKNPYIDSKKKLELQSRVLRAGGEVRFAEGGQIKFVTMADMFLCKLLDSNSNKHTLKSSRNLTKQYQLLDFKAFIRFSLTYYQLLNLYK
jgi:hypothetical protein